MATILVIDDDNVFRSVVRDALVDGGHVVREASGGLAGLEQVKSAPPDIVITDIVMAEGEGIETILALRELAPDLPVIVMSGNSDYLRSAGLISSAETLLKPFHMSKLTALLDKVSTEGLR